MYFVLSIKIYGKLNIDHNTVIKHQQLELFCANLR